jgi:hypothetical protein
VKRYRLRILSLIFLLAVLFLAVPAGAASPPFLVRYSFDDGLTDTGPDTFTVFRNAKGSVQLSRAFHVSGYRSLEIRDVAGDGDFPELQGFFPERRDGRLFLHFALLVTNPREELNVAMAGPGWFELGKDGIALWLIVKNGVLRHVSDSIPKRLLRIKPFTWYGIDVDYDVARGRYDLLITEEGSPKPVVSLKNQPNASPGDLDSPQIGGRPLSARRSRRGEGATGDVLWQPRSAVGRSSASLPLPTPLSQT